MICVKLPVIITQLSGGRAKKLLIFNEYQDTGKWSLMTVIRAPNGQQSPVLQSYCVPDSFRFKIEGKKIYVNIWITSMKKDRYTLGRFF